MRFESTSRWLTLLANFGVLLGIVVLVYEIRQNTVATELEVAATFESTLAEAELFIAGDPDFAELLAKGIDGENISRVDQLRLTAFYRRILRSWQFIHYQYLTGALEEYLWLGQREGLRHTFLADQGLRESWRANKGRYSDQFNALIDSFAEGVSGE